MEFPYIEKDILRMDGEVKNVDDVDTVGYVGVAFEDVKIFTPVKDKRVSSSHKFTFDTEKKLYWRGKQLLQEDSIKETMECLEI